MDGCTSWTKQKKTTTKKKTFNAIRKLGRARVFFFTNNSDCIHLKEECHIHLGWLEGE